jgi:hypothetical protein
LYLLLALKRVCTAVKKCHLMNVIRRMGVHALDDDYGLFLKSFSKSGNASYLVLCVLPIPRPGWQEVAIISAPQLRATDVVGETHCSEKEAIMLTALDITEIMLAHRAFKSLKISVFQVARTSIPLFTVVFTVLF